MDWQLIVGLLAGSCALVLLAYIEGRESDEPLPPPRMDLIKRGGHDHWVVSEGRDRT